MLEKSHFYKNFHFLKKKKKKGQKSEKKWILKNFFLGPENRLWTNIGGNEALGGPLRFPKPFFNHFQNF